MINPEHLHDALTHLPEDLLIPVDILRQKRRIPWKSLTALAACLCLAVGLWFFFPGGIAMDNAGNTAERAPAAGLCDSVSHSTTGEQPLCFLVTGVSGDQITVVPRSEHTEDGNTADTATEVLDLTGLVGIPPLQPGQHIHVYYDTFGTENTVRPCRIEIIDN